MAFKHSSRLAFAIALASGSASALAEDLSKLRVNGYATAGFSSVTEDFGGKYLGDLLNPGKGIDNDGSYKQDNVLGIQLSYQVDDRINLVGQLISRGKDDYDTRAEWAYLAYGVNDDLRLRAGRFALPAYMYSETINVGQTYPWARLPVEVYGDATLTNFDGVDVLHRLHLGSWDLNTQLYQGRYSYSPNPATMVEAKNLHGINATLSQGSFSVRLGLNEAAVTLTMPPGTPLPPINSEDFIETSLGMIFDDGNWFAAAEATQFYYNGYVPDMDAAFVSVGHYVGKWLPYVMASKVNSVNGDECRSTFQPLITAQLIAGGVPAPVAAAMAPGATHSTCLGLEKEQTTYALGFRYDISKRSSLKLQIDHVTDFHGTPGYFTTPTSGTPSATPGTLTDDDSTEVITINFNAAF